MERDATQQQDLATAVAALDRDFERAVLAADAASLRSLCAPDMRWTHSNFVRHQTGDEWIEWVAPPSGEPIYTQYTLEAERIEEHGANAVASGRLNVLFADGRPNSIRYVRVYALRDARLQLISHHSIPL